MKIRTAKDVEKLDQRIKDELGVDVQKYRNEEVVESFVSLLIFPQFVFTWLIKPVLVALGLFLIGFLVIDLVHIEFVLYATIGLSLFLLSGFFFGLIVVLWKMKKDMWGIVNYSLTILDTASSDVNQLKTQITPENKSEVLEMLFKGIIHIVTIPVASKAISSNVPLVGGIVNKVVTKFLTIVSDQIKFDNDSESTSIKSVQAAETTIDGYQSSIGFVTKGLEKVMDVTFGVAGFPIKIMFVVAFLFLMLFVYLIN